MQPPIITFKVLKRGQAPISMLYAFQNCRCFYCNVFMPFHSFNDNRKSGYTRDHLFPNSKNYGIIGNAVLACRKCNELKADRWPTNEEIVKAWELYQKIEKPFICSITFP